MGMAKLGTTTKRPRWGPPAAIVGGGPTRAFVPTGGGNRGGWQVGQLEGLPGAGIEPDLLVGTSVGALNAAAVAGDPTPEGVRKLAMAWRRTRRADVLPAWGWSRVSALRRRALYSNGGLRALIESCAPYPDIEDATVPLRVVTTSLETGGERVLSSGSVVDAVLASMAIPGIYPPVQIGEERLIDGGIVDNVPVRPAVEEGADEVFVLAASSRCPPPERVRHLHDVLLYSAWLMLRPPADALAGSYGASVKVVVLPSSCPVALRPFDFSQTDRLIASAREQTAAFLEGAEVPA